MKYLLSSLMIGVLLLAPVQIAQAQSSASSLTLIPPVIESNYGPGDTGAETVRLRNDSESNMTLYTYIQDFYFDDRDKMIFISGDEEELPEDYDEVYKRFSLRDWITITDKIEIAANSEARVSFNINVPEDALPGGRYAAIFFSRTPVIEGQSNAVGVGSDLGLLVSAIIPGDENNSRYIGKVRAGRVKADGSFKNKFFFIRWLSLNNGPFSFALNYQNESYSHKRVETIFVIDNVLFNKPSITFREESSRIFPGVNRTLIGTHDVERMYGIYKIFADSKDSEGIRHTSHNYYIALPPLLWLLILILMVYLTRKYLKYRDKKTAERLQQELKSKNTKPKTVKSKKA
jgi:hypothetical protein